MQNCSCYFELSAPYSRNRRERRLDTKGKVIPRNVATSASWQEMRLQAQDSKTNGTRATLWCKSRTGINPRDLEEGPKQRSHLQPRISVLCPWGVVPQNMMNPFRTGILFYIITGICLNDIFPRKEAHSLSTGPPTAPSIPLPNADRSHIVGETELGVMNLDEWTLSLPLRNSV